MRPFSLLGSLVLGLGLVAAAQGAEPGCRWWWPWGLRFSCCPCCPDDYCPKKLPCAPCPVHSGGRDDYCPKSLPVPCPLKYCGHDDYCPKACPTHLPPCSPPWYTCVPAGNCGPRKAGCP
jgi:hypothetical protein